MNAVVPINRVHKEVRVATPEDAWAMLPEKKRDVANKRAQLVKPIITMMEDGCSATTAIQNLLLRIETGRATPSMIQIAYDLGKNGKPVNKQTLQRWKKAYQESGLVGLANGNKGSKRKEWGWEVRAMHLYQSANRPAFSTVADWLREEGFETATDSRVRSYLKSLPTNLTTSSPKRVGKHYYNQNMKPYIVRDNEVIPVGLIYQGDGHCCDTYVQHPTTGKHWRPELTAWIDVPSHYIPAWWLSESESAVTTLYALSWAITKHDHVPAAIHTDPGSGFKNRMMDHEVTGYLNRMSIQSILAIPGNAKGKGHIERWFGIFEERCGKKFESYCGHCRTDDALSRFETKVRRGEITVPTLEQYKDAIEQFIHRYNNTPQKSLNGKTPADLWATLERTPVEIGADILVKPQEIRRVRRWGITLWNRLYRAPELAGYEGKDLVVEYNLHDMAVVDIRNKQGQLICEARMVEKKPGLSDSRIEELQQKRLKGQIGRKTKQIEEMEARAGLALTHDQELEFIDGVEIDSIPQKETETPFGVPVHQPVHPASTGIDLDLDDTDY